LNPMLFFVYFLFGVFCQGFVAWCFDYHIIVMLFIKIIEIFGFTYLGYFLPYGFPQAY